MHPDIFGWAATAVLMARLIRQMVKQWQAPHPEAVSKWLFLGQMTASILFTVYSALLGSTVFVVTNVLLLFSGVVGQVMASCRRHRSAAQRSR